MFMAVINFACSFADENGQGTNEILECLLMLWWSTALGVLDWSVASASESMGSAMETFYMKRAQQLCENSSASIGQGHLNLFLLNLLVLGSSNTEDNRARC